MRTLHKNKNDNGSGLATLKWVALALTAIPVCIFFTVSLKKTDYHSLALVFWFIGMAAAVMVTAILFWADKKSS